MTAMLDGHVDPLSPDRLLELAGTPGAPKVSLFLPTHRLPAQTHGDRVLLSNLLRNVWIDLSARGLHSREINELVGPAARRLKAASEWDELADGLGLFLAPDWSASLRLPYPVGPEWVVGGPFHVGPLLPHAIGDEPFWLLALSRNDLRLWRGGRHRLTQQDLPGVPTTVHDALWFEDPAERLQLHATAASRGGTAAMYHGHGGTADDHHAAFERFVHIVTPGLSAPIRSAPAPVILAAEADDAARFTKISDLGSMVIGTVHGNPELTRPLVLHAAAQAFLRERQDDRLSAVLGEIEDRSQHGRSSDNAAKVAEAAAQGRIEQLVVRQDACCWGAVHPDKTATLHPQRQRDSVDLVGFSAVAALRAGATLLVAPTGRVTSPVLALLRY
jgi:hypothetical protein